jgi:hypothetical protein
VRHAVQQLGDVAGEVRVPGVTVHDVGAAGAAGAGRHRQVHAHGAQRRVGAGQFGRFRVRRDARFVAFAAEAVHPDVRERPQIPGQVLQVDTGAAVHLRRVLPGEQVDAERGGTRIGHSS